MAHHGRLLLPSILSLNNLRGSLCSMKLRAHVSRKWGLSGPQLRWNPESRGTVPDPARQAPGACQMSCRTESAPTSTGPLPAGALATPSSPRGRGTEACSQFPCRVCPSLGSSGVRWPWPSAQALQAARPWFRCVVPRTSRWGGRGAECSATGGGTSHLVNVGFCSVKLRWVLYLEIGK